MNRRLVSTCVKLLVKFNTVLELILIRNLMFYCWLNFNKRNKLFSRGYDLISFMPLLIVSCLYSMTGGYIKNMLSIAKSRVTNEISRLYIQTLMMGL